MAQTNRSLLDGQGKDLMICKSLNQGLANDWYYGTVSNVKDMVLEAF